MRISNLTGHGSSIMDYNPQMHRSCHGVAGSLKRSGHFSRISNLIGHAAIIMYHATARAPGLTFSGKAVPPAGVLPNSRRRRRGAGDPPRHRRHTAAGSSVPPDLWGAVRFACAASVPPPRTTRSRRPGRGRLGLALASSRVGPTQPEHRASHGSGLRAPVGEGRARNTA